jgi:hypothetical protein
MCTVSFEKVLNITVHNQYPSLELTSPVYFSTNTTNCVPPSRQTDTDSIMKTSFRIDYKQKDLKCVSLYKLQRKHATKIDNQHDSSTISIENTTTNMYLLVAWVADDYDHKFHVCLLECTDDFAWDEDKLWSLYEECNDQFHMDDISKIIIWSIHGNAIMKTKLEVSYGSEYELDIVISEGNRKDDMKEPMKINPKRLVLSLSLLTVLIYAVRLLIRPSFKLNIYNQCMNVDLIFPAYFTGEELEFHKPPNYNVCTSDMMRSAFIISRDLESYGVLIYRLQRKQPHEYTKTNEDTSNTVHLLVVWEISESEKLFANVLLVEHNKGFDWEKDNLEELYHENINRFRLCPDSVTEAWSLHDSIALMTTFEIMNIDRMLNITISEVERDDNTRIPAHIDLERYVILEIMLVVITLMHTVSLKLQLPACVTIHNQCSNIKLVSPIYFGKGTICPKLSSQRMDIGTEMDASFEIYATQDVFEGALLYNLQRYSESDDQRNIDILTKETNKNEAKYVQMFVAWKMEDSKPLLYLVLIEHTKEFIWNENELRKLYNKNHNRLKEYDDAIPDGWLIDNNMVLETSFEVRGLKGDFELSIFVSEEKRRDYMRPLCIDLER